MIPRALELLAPAKDLSSAIAAVDYGADALYIGGEKFGARRGACNSMADVARAVEYAHQFGVKVYGTLNTLLYDHELEQARAAAMEFVEAGVDALIVQDMALLRMGLPIELHASTQMCNNSLDGVRFLADCGLRRVVLERALSLKEIRAIAEGSGADIEAFVHGAICVGYSGRCLLSRASSERSGNRGECSQPCRLPYDLCTESGEVVASSKHLLSVLDLDLSARLGEMIDAGVSSFKIEGRLKEIGYTKNIVAHYRQALDREIAKREGYSRSSSGRSIIDFEPCPSKSFSRGGSEYMFDGVRSGVASFDTPKAVGEPIGRITSLKGGRFRLSSDVALVAQDGICFHTTAGLVGTNVNSVDGQWVTPNRSDGLEVGMEIYRNFDRSFAKALESSRTRRVIECRAELRSSRSRVELTYIDIDGHRASALRDGDFAEAANRERMEGVIREQCRKSGGTIFEVVDVSIEGDGEFIPSSLLASLRREVLDGLLEQRMASYKVGGEHFAERLEPRYIAAEVTAEQGVANHLAEQFYLDHGAERVERSYELSGELDGKRVMESSYCIRREIGECLREGSALREELYLRRGNLRFKLNFDCALCRMSLIKM